MVPTKRAEVLNFTEDKISGFLPCWDKTIQGEDCPGPSLQTSSYWACPSVSTRMTLRVQSVLLFSLSFPICIVGVLVSDSIQWIAVSRKESKSVHTSCSLHFKLPFREKGTTSCSPGNMGEWRDLILLRCGNAGHLGTRCLRDHF